MLTVSKTNTASVLASFATLKSLSDAKKYQSAYQILREFIGYIITTDSLYSFSAIEMKNRLAKHFSFSIPEAVIKTSIKNMDGLSLARGIYNVSMSEIGRNSLFTAKKREADGYESHIIQLLSEYISLKIGNNSIDEELLTRELVSFLTEDQTPYPTRYTDLIGEFVLKNECNDSIQSGLNKIREGSILYLGLSHNIGEVGSITKPLTLYLGTEILFSFIGYNGKIHQQFANDFYDQVRVANSGNFKKISLHYFADIRKEIDEFFYTASEIVGGKRSRLLDKPAMKAITDGCSTSSDVEVRKSDFYYKLEHSYGITEDANDCYYDEEYFSTNLESFEYDDETDKNKKKEIAIKLISHINKLRKGNRYYSDIDAEYLLVTNTKATLLISKGHVDSIKEKEELDNICNFAVSLDRIISLLWYKLGNGFAKKEFPSSMNAILKARVVLSSSIAKNAEKAFLEVKTQYEAGIITEDQVAARIITLRKKPSLPENLHGDDIDEIMDFSPEYLSRYEEQFNNTQNSLKKKDDVIETLKADAKKALSEKDDAIVTRDGIIRKKGIEITKLSDEIKEYQRKESATNSRKERRKNVWKFVWSIIWKIAILAGATILAIILENRYQSKIPTYLSAVINIFGLGYTFWSAIKKDKGKYLTKKEKSDSFKL